MSHTDIYIRVYKIKRVPAFFVLLFHNILILLANVVSSVYSSVALNASYMSNEAHIAALSDSTSALVYYVIIEQHFLLLHSIPCH